MDPVNFFFGLVQTEVTSADLPELLRRITQAEIPVYGLLSTGELSAVLMVHRQDYRRLRAICEKSGASFRIQKRRGLYWRIKGILSRPVLVIGLLVLLLISLYLPSRVLFVRVQGNQILPSRRILEAAGECGIGFGASRKAVRSEKVKNALLEALPQLQWAGVNTSGCVATISVRERPREEMETKEEALGNIVAARDGIITQCTATRGTLLCTPGQAVTQGQILISGYTDCGISIRAEQAQGEIYGQTLRSAAAIMPMEKINQVPSGKQLKKISLLVGKKRVFLWKDSGIWDATCDRIYEEYYVTLPGGFQLPFAVALDIYPVCSQEKQSASAAEREILLGQLVREYLLEQMTAGQITLEQISIENEAECLRLKGAYVCMELIGKMQRLEIGEYYGEDN